MPQFDWTAVSTHLAQNEPEILDAWVVRLKANGASGGGRIREAEWMTQCRTILSQLRGGIATAGSQFDSAVYSPLRETLAEASRTRANQGFSPRETATFVYSLKQPLMESLTKAGHEFATVWETTLLIDALGLFTMESFQTSREQLIVRQQQEIAELSTPVVKLWDGILALPLIGTLDSQRTQVVMENLLDTLASTEAQIAIIDITGVPTVDTLTAQHLLKTVAAARLMGADCIISGIRPQIAQTMVHLGVELNVVSKASLADAFALAIKRLGLRVVKQEARTPPSSSGSTTRG